MRELIFIIVMFVSTTLRAAFGFGNALLAMPILVVLYGLRTATPVVAISAVFIAAVILLRDYEYIEFSSITRLILSSAAGIPLGIILLRGKHEALLTLILGCILILYGTLSCRLPKVRSRIHVRYSYIAGFIAGILGGAYNTNGPPVVIYAALRGWNPREFRASLQGYFLLAGMIVAAGHWVGGLWSPGVLRLCIVSVVPVCLGLVLGTIANQHFPADRFARYVAIVLIVLGLFMIIQGFQPSDQQPVEWSHEDVFRFR